MAIASLAVAAAGCDGGAKKDPSTLPLETPTQSVSAADPAKPQPAPSDSAWGGTPAAVDASPPSAPDAGPPKVDAGPKPQPVPVPTHRPAMKYGLAPRNPPDL